MLKNRKNSGLRLVSVNPEPARTVKRAGLRVVEVVGVDWAAVRKAADDFCKRTEWAIKVRGEK